MRKYYLIFGLGLACLLTSSVFANGKAYVLHQPACYAIPGWVIGADIGWGYLDTPENNLFFDDGVSWNDLSQSHDIGDIVWGIHGGRTFDITPSMLLGFEVGYKDLGRSKYKSTWALGPREQSGKLTRKVDQQAIDVLLTGNYFVWQGFNLFAKAGMAYVESTTKQTFSGEVLPSNNTDYASYYNTKESIWRLRPEVIFGMGYMFNNFDVHVLYDYVYGVTETQWNSSDYENSRNPNLPQYPPKPRTYGANLVMGGISYTF